MHSFKTMGSIIWQIQLNGGRMKKGRTAAADVFRQQNNYVDNEHEVQIEQERGHLRDEDVSEVHEPAPVMLGKEQQMMSSVAVKKRVLQEDAMNLDSSLKTSEELQLESEPVAVRITGSVFRKRVVVPPNAYVVHTRAGQEAPVTIGLGLSFKYRPATDAYLVVPAAMQTIGVVANCISQEKQGVNILAYVQWQIDDFATAYRKIDFSNKNDPLGIVNAQLREQAEAAIKDKIATMTIEEVLTDKAPVIEELTTRLKAVAQGRDQNEGGMGIKMVTVQIKEAVVASAQLWNDLQQPFRHEKEKLARMSQLQLQQDVQAQTLNTEQATAIQRARSEADIEAVQLAEETRRQQLRHDEEVSRIALERERARQEVEQHTVDQLHRLEEEKNLQEKALAANLRNMEIEAELARERDKLALEAQRAHDELQAQIAAAELERDMAALSLEKQRIELEKLRHETCSSINENMLLAKLIDQLPALAEAMPEIDELRVIQTGEDGAGSIAGLVSQVMAVANTLGLKPTPDLELADKA